MKHCQSSSGADDVAFTLKSRAKSRSVEWIPHKYQRALANFQFLFRAKRLVRVPGLCFRLGGWRGHQWCGTLWTSWPALRLQKREWEKITGAQGGGGRGANQEENWTLRIVSDDWSWIEGIGPIQFLFSNSPQCSRSHRNSALKVTKPLEREKVVYKIQSGTPASIQILQSAFIHLSWKSTTLCNFIKLGRIQKPIFLRPPHCHNHHEPRKDKIQNFSSKIFCIIPLKLIKLSL